MLYVSLFLKGIFLAGLVETRVAHAGDSDRLVVTASRIETPAEEIGSSLTVITGKELHRGQARTVGEALRALPGVSVVNSGGPGQLTRVYVRGAGSGHTLVLIDGVKANDPADISRSFDFGNLSTDHIERIEILRGPESVLYGSDSTGGVIQIFTKRGGGPLKSAIEGEYGRYRSYRTAASLSGGEHGFSYSLSGELAGTTGFSAADERLGNPEADGRVFSGFSGRFGMEPLEKLRADLSARYSYAKLDNDFSGGAGGDDPDFTTVEKKLALGLKVRSVRSLWWQPSIAAGYSLTRRVSESAPDPVQPGFFDHARYEGSRMRLELQNDLFVSDESAWTLLLEGEREAATARDDSSWGLIEFRDRAAAMGGLAVQYQYAADEGFFATASARLDRHSRAGTRATYRLAPGYRFGPQGLVLRGSLGSGFKAPSLFQLFGGVNGNPELRPETSVGFDLGAEMPLSGGGRVSIAVFNTFFDGLIVASGLTAPFRNSDETSSRGVEISSEGRVIPALTGGFSYTYTRARSDRTGLPLEKIPFHELSARLSHEFVAFSQPAEAMLQARYVGARLDFAGAMLQPYFLLGSSARMRLENWATGLSAFGRLENILDTEYQEVSGYGTAGRSLTLGLRQEF
ncbi:MAG: TonB-dependent receptor [Oligoflexia bacterium]|nr:TonB-dependent receptor [Oligoflexia bacterium]